MLLLGDKRPEKRSIFWLGIIRTLLVQVLVLLALSGAIVRYLNWSSEAAWAEFIGAGKPSVQEKPHTQLSTPVQAVTRQVACYGRA